MDQDFFEGENTNSGQQVTPAQTVNQAPVTNQDHDQFDFGDSSYQTPGIQHQGSNQQNTGSYGNLDYANNVDTEAVRKIQEEEERIQRSLREKSETEYEQKKKRKEEGKKLLQEFIQKKQIQTMLRKQENKAKQQSKLKQIKRLSQEAGWKKVAANVSLKQGESKAKKDTNRMRQAILNKRMDQN